MSLPSSELLDEICVRYILSLPESDLESFERLLFCIEQAWWHYEDNIREQDPGLRSLSLKEFCALIFEAVPGLEHWRGSLEQIYAAFNQYKRAVPVRGAVLLSPDLGHCLLVRGWRERDAWGFPRGKLSRDEEDAACAAREVAEETGLDVSALIQPDEYVEVDIGAQNVRLYIVPGVDMATQFAPTVRYEIGGFAWHAVADLPSTFDQDKRAYVSAGGKRHRFFNVWQFVRPLQAWIAKRRKAGKKGANRKKAEKIPMFPRTAAALAAPAAIARVESKQEPPAPAQGSGQATVQPTVIPTSTHGTQSAAGTEPAGAGPMTSDVSAPRPAPLDEFVFDRAAVMAALQQAMTAR